MGSEYASVSEVPGSMDAMSVMEEERFIAAATFGLAGSAAGAQVLAHTPHTMKGALMSASSISGPNTYNSDHERCTYIASSMPGPNTYTSHHARRAYVASVFRLCGITIISIRLYE